MDAHAPVRDAAALALFRGQPLCLRELCANDRIRIEALLAQTAAADLHMRFFGLFHGVPPALLDQLMRVDPARRLTVAAVREGGCGHDAPEILGVARAHRIVDETAEAALLVRSDLKGKGLGSMLLASLIARCRNWGVSQIIAEVMRHNSRMLRLAQKYGFRCESVHENSCQLVLDLTSRG